MSDLKKKYQRTPENPFSIKSGEFKYGKLQKTSYIQDWIEGSYLSKGKESEVIGRTFDFSKLRLIFLFISLFLSIIISRVIWLQIIKGDEYRALAENNRTGSLIIEPNRGIIYDRNKKPLVRNLANFLLYVQPIDLPIEEADRMELVEKIGKIIYYDEEEQKKFEHEFFKKLVNIDRRSLEAYAPLFIVDDIEYDKALSLDLLIDEMPGVFLLNKSKREYLNQEIPSLSHILGYTGKMNEKEYEDNKNNGYDGFDSIGKSGIEYFWEKDLKGEKGEKIIEEDALGHEKKILSKIDQEDGVNLVLTIDYGLQKKVEEILKKYLEEMNLKKGVVIMMDPNNGEILAIVSLPGFDNNLFAQGISQENYTKLIEDENNPLFNRAVSGEYPSGSTIKPVVAVAALEEKVVSEDTIFMSTGGIRISQWYFPDWKAGGHGWTDVRKAIADSVNTYFYYIGGGYEDFTGLGVNRLVEYFKMFGLGEKTGIDLSNEASGLVPTREWKTEVKDERWYIGDTYHLAIGQGDLLVTPLQVANFTAFFASSGKIYKPHLVKDILGKDDELIRSIEKEIVKENILDDYNILVVRQGMRRTVTKGSGRKLDDLSVEVAGKTGTAQWSSKGAPHAWFTGFAPYNNPEVVITVLAEEGEEGSKITVDITKEILDYYFNGEVEVELIEE